MSNVALSSNPLGTGTFTIASPNSNTDRTLNLPDAAGTFVTANGSNQLVAPASGILFADATTQTTAGAAVLTPAAGDNYTGDSLYVFTTGSSFVLSPLRFLVTATGVVRTGFTIRAGSNDFGTPQLTYAVVYKNGVAVGTTFSTSSASPATFSQDLSVTAGDVLQVAVRMNGTFLNFATTYLRIGTNIVALGTIVASVSSITAP